MKVLSNIHLTHVQSVYSGPEADLWQLIMGEQIHIGGFTSSMDLAETAGIGAGSCGIDLCCCTGAGMRFLLRFRNVASMTGVDATRAMIRRGMDYMRRDGMESRATLVEADACKTGLPDNGADFVWGEDAWCYVENKTELVAEACRIVRPGGCVAFTDWMEGEGLTDAEATRYMTFMKFPSILTLKEYSARFEQNGCKVVVARDTGRFKPAIDLYLQMVGFQLTSDALRIVGHDMNALQAIAAEMAFIQSLAASGKIVQGLLVARRP